MDDRQFSRPWLTLGFQALQAARYGDWTLATARLQRLADEHGAERVPIVMLSWCDVCLHAYGIAPNTGGVPRLIFVHAETGDVDSADTMENPAVVWAGQLLAARAAGDRLNFEALVGVAFANGEDALTERLGALLNLTALAVNASEGPPLSETLGGDSDG